MRRVLCATVLALLSVPLYARSAAVDGRVREQIADACEGKGTIRPASVIERDLTGDGAADLIIHHEGIECEGRGRSLFCGAQECSAHLYVRDGETLRSAGQFGAVEWIKVEGGKRPTIRTVSHGGKPLVLRWNGRAFQTGGVALASQGSPESRRSADAAGGLSGRWCASDGYIEHKADVLTIDFAGEFTTYKPVRFGGCTGASCRYEHVGSKRVWTLSKVGRKLRFRGPVPVGGPRPQEKVLTLEYAACAR